MFWAHDCGMRGGYLKPSGGASDTVLETEMKKPEDRKMIILVRDAEVTMRYSNARKLPALFFS